MRCIATEAVFVAASRYLLCVHDMLFAMISICLWPTEVPRLEHNVDISPRALLHDLLDGCAGLGDAYFRMLYWRAAV